MYNPSDIVQQVTDIVVELPPEDGVDFLEELTNELTEYLERFYARGTTDPLTLDWGPDDELDQEDDDDWF